MALHVVFQMLLFLEGLVAQTAIVCLFSRVKVLLMHHKMLQMMEALTTLVTVVRSLPCATFPLFPLPQIVAKAVLRHGTKECPGILCSSTIFFLTSRAPSYRRHFFFVFFSRNSNNIVDYHQSMWIRLHIKT